MKEQDETNRLKELIELLCDDQLDGDSIQELESLLSSDPSALRYYVEAVDLHTRLHRQQGTSDVVEVAQLQSTASNTSLHLPSKRLSLWLATAVCVSLVLGSFAGMKFSSSLRLSSTDPESQAIATLSSASGCRWSAKDGSRYEGQRLLGESLRLEAGIAMVRFDSDVTLTIEGPTRLDLVSVNRARLCEGKAVFRGMTDLDAFTLETPFSKILDEGTEYAVSVDPANDATEVHVFDGRVQCETEIANQSPVRVDAGEARRFAARGSDVSIPLAASRFTRKPAPVSSPKNELLLAESFDYEAGLPGQSGGTGWASSWKQINLDKPNSFNDFISADSIGWPGRAIQDAGGCLQIAGNTSLSRMMGRPIRMNRDASYYVSFLVRRSSVDDDRDSKGWAFFTMRDSLGNKIAISPLTQRGAPKLIHNGRPAFASVSLGDDSAYLFVAKIQAQRDKADQVFVQVFNEHDAIDSVEPLNWTFSTQPILDDSVFDQIRIVSHESQPIQIDDLRIGRTWGMVTSGYQSQADQVDHQ